ncbi:MAG: hypothetical protein AAGI01_05440, partial [Myxococcota bacterium]
ISIKDPELVARAQLAMASWSERYGNSRGAQQLLKGALNLMSTRDPPQMDLNVRARLLNHLINVWCQRGMHHFASRYVEDLQYIAQVTGLPAISSRVEWARACILASYGEYLPAREAIMRAEAIASRHGLTALRIELARQHATLAIEADDFESTLGILNALLGLSEQHKDAYSFQRAQDMRSYSMAMIGLDLDDALVHLQQSLQRASFRQIPRDIYRSHLFLKRILERSGDAAAAAHHAAQSKRFTDIMRLPITA